MTKGLPSYDTWRTSLPLDSYDECVMDFIVIIEGECQTIKSEPTLRKLVDGVVLLLSAATDVDISMIKYIELKIDHKEDAFIAVVDIEATIFLPIGRSQDQEVDFATEFANELEMWIEKVTSGFGSTGVFVHPA